MNFYVFDQGFGVMAESEEAARQTVRDQWADEHIGDPEEAAKGKLMTVVGPNKLVPFFC